jgi:hypothetical protein
LIAGDDSSFYWMNTVEMASRRNGNMAVARDAAAGCPAKFPNLAVI